MCEYGGEGPRLSEGAVVLGWIEERTGLNESENVTGEDEYS